MSNNNKWYNLITLQIQDNYDDIFRPTYSCGFIFGCDV